jgi:hypothetical protein
MEYKPPRKKPAVMIFLLVTAGLLLVDMGLAFSIAMAIRCLLVIGGVVAIALAVTLSRQS